MLVAGGAIAGFVAAAMAIARRENDRGGEPLPPQRDAIAASLLFHVVSASGIGAEETLREIRRGAGLAAPVTRGIDVTSWAESYARISTAQQRIQLLETAVQLIAKAATPVPLRQYAALLDLSFGLGFQTDALARLRAVYGFDYIDHAKDARPRAADRAGGAAPLYVRGSGDAAPLLAILGISGKPTRQEISAAYRRLASQHHPDRFHAAADDARHEAATRFIEITRAYEELLLIYRD